MKLSVVMTTYNGEKYIREQMNSILKQTRSADEIIIVDDCSTDDTVRIINGYAKENGFIKFHSNKYNKGWKKNFFDAMLKSTGDILVLSDQDDIWYENRLEDIEKLFLQHPEIELLASEFDELKDGVIRKKKSKKILSVVQADEKLIHTYYPGCTYAIKQELFLKIKSIWDESLPHDAQVGIASKIRHSMYVYGEPMIVYRRHQNNVTKRTPPSLSKKKGFISDECAYVRFAYRLINEGLEDIPDLERMQNRLLLITDYIGNREKLVNGFSIKAMIRAIKFRKYYYSLKTCLGDIVFGLRLIGE